MTGLFVVMHERVILLLMEKNWQNGLSSQISVYLQVNCTSQTESI